jgi:hypothetical protein
LLSECLGVFNQRKPVFQALFGERYEKIIETEQEMPGAIEQIWRRPAYWQS